MAADRIKQGLDRLRRKSDLVLVAAVGFLTLSVGIVSGATGNRQPPIFCGIPLSTVAEYYLHSDRRAEIEASLANQTQLAVVRVHQAFEGDPAAQLELSRALHRVTTSLPPALPARSGATQPRRLSVPGAKPELLRAFQSLDDVPLIYRADRTRFVELSTDPAHSDTPPTYVSRIEAAVGLEAERLGILPGPIVRGPPEIEFYDSYGNPWDVKTPPSPLGGQTWQFDAALAGGSIRKELRLEPGVARSFPNLQSGKPAAIRILLNSTYLTVDHHRALWAWLYENLSPEELGRIEELLLSAPGPEPASPLPPRANQP